MDTEIVDYPDENFTFKLGTSHDPSSILFSSRPRVSSSESLQEIGANYFVSCSYVNMTQFVIQKTHMFTRVETNIF